MLEPKPTNDALREIAFAIPKDGTEAELDSKEVLLARQEFDAAVDDILLANAAAVKTYNGTVIKGESQSSVLLGIPYEDGSRLTISVESRSKDDNPGRAKRQISVQEINPDGYGKSYRRYHSEPGEDGVRRYDIPDLGDRTKRLSDERISFDQPSEIVINALTNKIASIKNEMQNAQLAKDMGLNDQLVGQSEMTQLLSLLAQAEPREV